MTCPNCGEDGLYDKRNGKRCALCGSTFEGPSRDLIDERPSRPHDADCGELVTDLPNHDKRIPKMVTPLCNDGSYCSLSAKTMTETDDGKYMATCTTHKGES